MTRRVRWDRESARRAQRDAVAIARRVVAGELGIMAGCRQLAGLGHDVVEDWRADQGFVIFGAIDSETDHLPLEHQRSLWSPAAFDEKQREIARFEGNSRDEVLAACRSVIARFAGV